MKSVPARAFTHGSVALPDYAGINGYLRQTTGLAAVRNKGLNLAVFLAMRAGGQPSHSVRYVRKAPAPHSLLQHLWPALACGQLPR